MKKFTTYKMDKIIDQIVLKSKRTTNPIHINDFIISLYFWFK